MLLASIETGSPSEATGWVRVTVRTIASVLARETAHEAWEWVLAITQSCTGPPIERLWGATRACTFPLTDQRSQGARCLHMVGRAVNGTSW